VTCRRNHKPRAVQDRSGRFRAFLRGEVTVSSPPDDDEDWPDPDTLTEDDFGPNGEIIKKK
jgi:hypothetical protein